MKIFQDTLISAPVDMATRWTSDAIFVGLTDTYTIQLTFIGIPEGKLALEYSIDKGNAEKGGILASANVDTYILLRGSEQLINEAGTHTWSCTNTGYRWVRAVWEPSVGEGSIVEAQIAGRSA